MRVDWRKTAQNLVKSRNKGLSKEAEVLFRNNIIQNLDLVIEMKITAEKLAETYQVSRSWIFELLRRKKAGEPLDRPKGHRRKIFKPSEEQKILKLYRELILEDGTTPSMTVLRECMRMQEPGITEASCESYRNIVKSALEYPNRQKKKVYRKRFEAPAVGFMVQGDVTTHAWIDSAYPFPLLMFIDDKSRFVLYADFIDSDNIDAHKTALKQWLKEFGKPAIVYYDNDPKYARNGAIRLLLEKAGIRIINTRPYKPQGKGKLERKNGVFQSQLVHFLKFKKAKSVEDARSVLKWYIKHHNQSLNREIQTSPEELFLKAESVFQKFTEQEWEDLENDFAVREKRKVSNINEIQINGKMKIIPKLDQLPLCGRYVDIIFRSQLWIKVYYKNQYVTKFDWQDIYD